MGVLVKSQVINEGGYVRKVSGLYVVMATLTQQRFPAQKISEAWLVVHNEKNRHNDINAVRSVVHAYV